MQQKQQHLAALGQISTYQPSQQQKTTQQQQHASIAFPQLQNQGSTTTKTTPAFTDLASRLIQIINQGATNPTSSRVLPAQVYQHEITALSSDHQASYTRDSIDHSSLLASISEDKDLTKPQQYTNDKTR
jgi:hypothetical protein